MSLGSLFTGIDSARTDDYTQTVAGVTTAAGVYAANVTLGQSVYDDEVASIVSVSSNISSDSPSAYSWNSVSNVLWVSGLEADETRTLEVDFLINSVTLEAGASAYLVLFFWFLMFVPLGMMAGAIYNFWQS